MIAAAAVSAAAGCGRVTSLERGGTPDGGVDGTRPEGGADAHSPECATLDEAACQLRSDCQAQRCPGCNGQLMFETCAPAGTAPPLCARISCPVTIPCASVSTLDECEVRTDCHSVFVDPGTCGCAAVGCCAHFSRCADGDLVPCKASAPGCASPPPFCETPVYVVSYANNGCPDGCVQPKDCAP